MKWFQKKVEWMKANVTKTLVISFLLVQVGMLFWVHYKGKKATEEAVTAYWIAQLNDDTKVQTYGTFDFQNPGGLGRIKSSFGDVLVHSRGSERKGDGYILKYTIVNPLSITLVNLTSKFWIYRDGNKKEIQCGELTARITPGGSSNFSCFFSDLTDSDLKAVSGSFYFDQASYKRNWAD
jgi:cbb3-type cytochrome oxidase subunit 3